MLKLAWIMGSIAWKIFLLLKQIDLNFEKDMMYPFFKISGKNIKEEQQSKENSTSLHPTLVQGVPRYPTRPALWLDLKKRKRTCSSRHTSIHDIKTKTAIEDGMDHFTLSASKNTKEWSTDVGGYGNLANEFMQTSECHAAVDTWTSIVRKHQCRSTSIRTEAATAIASHQNNGFEMIRDLDGDVARFSTLPR
ncbi:hypothetical protein OUZ56_016544 [Daphnia magna]|uniref:Uncharacterized protein n=1 Tax=Daphnia magna TaxID=35525 RepID=A0ABR0AQU9_9CRUS|nr:hypothetical protein OUZ56_016544 [Daphnia magna]